MGDTKEINLQRGLKLVRIIAAALTGLFFVVAFANVLFFQEIKVYFQTGAEAQQIESIKIKKGSDVKLPTPLKQGSYFLGWSLSPDSAEILQDSTGLMQDTTLYAVWDGSEKYAVLSVNGMPYREVNIFETSVEGLTGDELNFGKFGHDSWRVLDDYALDNEKVIKNYNGTGKNVDLNNNFSRFMGWQYLNQYNTYNELRYEQDARGNAGKWTWVKRDEDGQEIEYITIDDEHKFYPPNYRTTFTALLDYRTINIQLWDSGANSNYTTFTAKLGEKNVTLPVFKNDPAAHFSHWEIVEGALKISTGVNDKPELASLLGNIKKRYAAGETLKVLDPLWYYYGSKLVSPDGKADLQVYLRFEAVYWDNTSNYQYTVQPFTDLDSGTNYKDFGVISEYSSDFNVENPVAYDSANQVIWLYDDRQIFSYSFYDHKGVYHILDTARFNGNVAISIGSNVSVLGEQIYLIDNWGVNIMVNYQSSAVDVTVKFNYGDGLYVLPDYHYENTVVKRFSSKIGNSFDLWSGEKYVKSNYIFTGWKIAGDSSEHLYCAGEKFTISNFDTQNESTVIEFVADWHLQRLLFDFDFDGGSWQTEEGPDFTLMKGTYQNRVRIVAEKPVKFGYDFVGWTLENGTQYLQPNEFIYVGSKFQTLHAHWTETRLHVNFSFKYDEEGSLAWEDTDVDIHGDTLKTNGVVSLPQVSNNRYYTFNGWQIGNQVITERQYQLTVQALSQLEWEYDTDENGAILEVYIRAAQTKRTLKVKNYNFDIAVESGSVNISHNVDQSRLETVLTQGDYFYNYYPFSEARINGSYAAFNTAGRQFVSWYYNLNGRAFPIDADTTVPYGVNEITVYGSLSEAKPFRIVYYNFNGNEVNLNQSSNITTTGAYEGQITLPNWSDFSANGVPETDQDWGAFVGWSFEPDVQAGNPAIIYDVYNYRVGHSDNNPLLKLFNQDDANGYEINIDHHASLVNPSDGFYTLRLHAIYANNYVEVKYLDTQSTGHRNLKFPIFANDDYENSRMGGRTVGYESNEFARSGVSVLDDNELNLTNGNSFVGWQVVEHSLDSASETVQNLFYDKIWLPGEFLPSIDFNLTFKPVVLPANGQVQNYIVGKRSYRILVLSSAQISGVYKFNGSVDIVVLPRGNYTVNEGGIIINSDRKVNLVVPADEYSVIELKPRAIQCDKIEEFYVGDNLVITGSPVIGANFQAYRVKKGYRLIGENNELSSDPENNSTKYDFSACLMGLLVSNDHVLYGVPCHTDLTADELLEFLEDDSITRVASYALSDVNSMHTINLAKNADLTIDAQAIYNVSASKIILPTGESINNLDVDPQVLSGALKNLTAVTFGNETDTSSWYAFTNNSFVYYVDNPVLPNAKTHLMYVLPTVHLDSLDYTVNNLTIDRNVATIEPCALMGLDWSRIKSVTAENIAVDLTILKGIRNDVPLFTDKGNPNTADMIQPYMKTFRFTYLEGSTLYEKEIEFAYGQTFRVFSAQKNNYGFSFNRSWSEFKSWVLDGDTNHPLGLGDVYQVGIDLIGDKYMLHFDASDAISWVSYPVRFITFSDANNAAYTPDKFKFDDMYGNHYIMSDLLKNDSYLNKIFLPGVDQEITVGNATYQFIGWTTQNMPNAPTPNNWNAVDVRSRVLPNHAVDTWLANVGRPNNVITYYALYEEVTTNVRYKLYEDLVSDNEISNELRDNAYLGTYVAYGISNTNINSLNIPFAKYYAGYMTPVTVINNNVFANVSNNANTALTQITIGGAVSAIGNYAFNGVKANEIKFNHKGAQIYYNPGQAGPKLSIGNKAFAGNIALGNLEIPAVATSLGDGAFQNCINLTTVSLETGSAISLKRLGNFVFSDNRNMVSNAVVQLLVDDGNNGDIRFVDGSVGDGIFMNTNITIPGTDRIVWRDTLLHSYYNGNNNFVVENEQKVAGYAFVNLDSGDSNNKITITFKSANIYVQSNAFSRLNTSVNTIDFKYSGYNNKNPFSYVNKNAFDDTIDHDVDVLTFNGAYWRNNYPNASAHFNFR